MLLFLSGYTCLLSVHSLIYNNMICLKQGVKGKPPGPDSPICKRCINLVLRSKSQERGLCRSTLSSPAAPEIPRHPPLLIPSVAITQQSIFGRCP